MEEEIRKALGLPETADQAAIVAAVTTLHAAKKEADALIGTIAEATGAKKDASGEEIVTALNGRLKEAETTGDAAELRKEVVSLNAKLTKLETSTAKERAELLIGRALEEGRLVPALKDHFISRHIKNPAEVETELKATPSLHSGGLKGYKPPATGEEGLSGDDAEICALMGLDPKAFAETAKTMREAL